LEEKKSPSAGGFFVDETKEDDPKITGKASYPLLRCLTGSLTGRFRKKPFVPYYLSKKL